MAVYLAVKKVVELDNMSVVQKAASKGEKWAQQSAEARAEQLVDSTAGQLELGMAVSLAVLWAEWKEYRWAGEWAVTMAVTSVGKWAGWSAVPMVASRAWQMEMRRAAYSAAGMAEWRVDCLAVPMEDLWDPQSAV